MSEIKDFLNPNSMLTPGIAGGITMMIANALWVNFALTPKYTALVLCLLLGLMVLAELKAPLWQKPVYYIINVLVIFSVSAGSNVVGMSASQTNLVSQNIQATGQQVSVSIDLPNISGFFIKNAVADNVRAKQRKLTAKKPNRVKPKQAVSSKSTRTATPLSKISTKSKKRAYFQSWF